MLAPAISTPTNQLERRLLNLATLFIFISSLALTFSPAARDRTWQVDYRWGHWVAVLLWWLLFNIAHQQSARWLPYRDPYLLPITALLCGWGLLTTWRLFPAFGLRQTFWLSISLIIFILGLRLPSELIFLRRYKYLWLTSALLITGLTLLLGTNPSGGFPHLWLGCCGLYLQPSEPLKLLLIVYLAAYMADRLSLTPASAAPLLPLLAPTLIMTGLALLLLLAQRDLGTASIFLFLYTVMIYITSGRKRILLIGGAAVLLAGVVGYAMFDVVRVRIDAWLNPWVDPSGRSFQIVQSLLAIANGGIIGRGLGLGSPGLVPIPHSDFIFASIAEEAGLLGALALLVVLALLATRGLRAAFYAPDAYRRYLAAGLSAYLVGQSILIIGGNLRLLPLTGVTLPFVSYGGSSLLTSFFSLLILMHISNQGERKPAALPEPAPYLQLDALLLLGLAAAGLIAGWWAIYRGPALLTRTDNPRRAITDRYVKRGSLLDRQDNPLNQTMGTLGNYVRQTLYPDLSSLLGYTDQIYGQAGLEASLDDYLRGVQGNPSLAIWWNHLLYGQPPTGVDIRLTLDLNLQRVADEQLGSRAGAVVLLNAESGEILAMASHPTFDANRLNEQWNQLIQDPQSPLLNRAIQGLYTAGPSTGPLLLAGATSLGDLPPLPQDLSYTLEGQTWPCALTPANQTWPEAIASGCPGAAVALGETLGGERLLALYQVAGLYSAPELRLPAASSPAPAAITDPARAALGLDMRVSPLQMALASAGLTAKGVRPPPYLVSAIKTPQAGWVRLSPAGKPVEMLPDTAARAAANSLALAEQPIWQSVAAAPNGPEQYVTWYLGGTLPAGGGEPLAIAVLLEENNPEQANQIGQAMLQAAMQQ